MSSYDRIDPEALIGLVEARPGLWDKSLDTHKALDRRSAAWRDICQNLCPDYESLHRKDKHIFVKSVIKKWTNIRDAWRKSVTDNNKNKLKPYIYHDRLKFLEKNLHFKQDGAAEDVTDNNAVQPVNQLIIIGEETADRTDKSYLDDSDDASDCMRSSITGNDGEDSMHRGVVRKRRTGELQESETNMIQFMDMKSINNQNEDNPHVCFIRGLLPMLNKLNDDESLEFQIGTIQLLQDIRKKSKPVLPESVPYFGVASSSIDLSIKEDLETV